MVVDPTNKIDEARASTGSGDVMAWHIAQCPFGIECTKEIFEQVRRAVESSRTSRRGERETGGVLFGIVEPRRILIQATKPLGCEHTMGPGFVLSANDETRLAKLIGAPATDPDLQGMEALGWYHSHVRSRIYLSARDFEIHTRYFPAAFQIALVVRPESDRPMRAGFFFRDAEGAMRTGSSYEEFVIGAPQPAAPDVRRALAPRPAPVHKHKSARPKPEAAPPEISCPKCGSNRLRRSRKNGPIEQIRAILGFKPYRCHECLSRLLLKTAPSLPGEARSHRKRRPEERRRVRERTRREVLLWGGGVFGFMAILYYLIRDSGPKADAP